MSIKLCLNTSTIKPQPLLEKIRLAAAAGYAAIELWINDVYEYIGQGGEVRDIEKALSDHGLTVPSMIALRGWAEASTEEYPIVLDEMRRRMELAARFQSTWIVCSPAREVCDHQQTVERYRDLLQLGRELGVRATFEYISFFRSVYQLEQAWDIVQRVEEPDATLILDAFHSWNSHSKFETLENIPLERISHYHIDDAPAEPPAGKQLDPHRVMVGDGVIDLKAELDLLKKKGYTGAVSLELFNVELWQRDPLEILTLGRERIQALLED